MGKDYQSRCRSAYLIQIAAALPMAMPFNRVVMVLFLTIVMCVLSGAIAGRHLRSADPADIFN